MIVPARSCQGNAGDHIISDAPRGDLTRSKMILINDTTQPTATTLSTQCSEILLTHLCIVSNARLSNIF